MSINTTEYTRALRVLAQNPGEIQKAEETYKTRLAEIKVKERSGDWSPNYILKERDEARATRDRVCNSLADAMKPAFQIVRDANDNLADQPLDFNSQKVQNALNVLNAVGKNLSFADQASLLEAFRGDHASLRFLQSAFQKNGLDHASRQAGEMMKSIPQQALDELETVLSFHSYAEAQGRYDFPAERMRWTHEEFQRQLDRIGAGPDDGSPYLRSLEDIVAMYSADTANPSIKMKYRSIAEVARLKIEDGADAATEFNKFVMRCENQKAADIAAAADANS